MVMPILVYHGRQKKWNSSLRYQDMLTGLCPQLRDQFGEEKLNFVGRPINLRGLYREDGLQETLPEVTVALISEGTDIDAIS